MSVRFAIEPLAKAHKRADFTCGNDRIDSYFRETVSQDVKRKYATCFVAKEIATNRVAGFHAVIKQRALERSPRAAGEEAAALSDCPGRTDWLAWAA